MKKRISSKKGEEERLFIDIVFTTFYHAAGPGNKRENWSRWQSCCATLHQQLNQIHPRSFLLPLALLPQLATHAAPTYKAAGTGSEDQAQLLVFALGATDGMLPSYSLVRLTRRKSKKENQIKLARAGWYCPDSWSSRCDMQLGQPYLELKEYLCSHSETRSKRYLVAEVGLWQAVSIHHIDQVI